MIIDDINNDTISFDGPVPKRALVDSLGQPARARRKWTQDSDVHPRTPQRVLSAITAQKLTLTPRENN